MSPTDSSFEASAVGFLQVQVADPGNLLGGLGWLGLKGAVAGLGGSGG